MKHWYSIPTLAVLVACFAWPPAGLADDSGWTTTTASSITTTANGTGYKLIGWNDLGMHCMDGKDYSLFAVLPPFNTIHAHLLDPSGHLLSTGFTVTYQAVNDPLTNTINTSSYQKTNFWKYALQLGFGALANDVGLKGYAMPGAANTPQPMTFSTTDNTFTAVGIPVTPYSDSGSTNYLPMMRLVAKNSSGTVMATTNIVTPVSDEMTCVVCHSSSGTQAAMPAAGWTSSVKMNILRKHDDRFASTSLFRSAATHYNYSTQGLVATVASKPVLCGTCHLTNALGTAGYPQIEPLTTAMHNLHKKAIDPATNQTLDSSTVRDACYRCHPGPNTKCLRGAMGNIGIQCQNCHGNLSTVATAGRQGWLNEPNCQSCHVGYATSTTGPLAFTSVFSTNYAAVRSPADQAFATNANTPSTGLSMYRYSKGHGGLQCEACHGSTHAEYATNVSNDNVQSTALQGHTGTIAECTACHSSSPSTVTGGPHGMHPIGQVWVGAHHDNLQNGIAQCQACHGVDYRGTILSRVKANRTFNADDYGTKTFAAGTIIGCYSCHNGPRGD